MDNMEQLSFDSTESCVDEMLIEIINTVCSQNDIDNNYISIVHNKNESISVWIKEPVNNGLGDRVFTVLKKDTKKIHRYEVSIRYNRKDNIPVPDDAEIKISDIKRKDENKDTYIEHKFDVYFPLESTTLKDYLYQILEYQLKAFKPSNCFGCCSRYIQCSDLKKCTHPQNFYAKACYYRQNLEAGRIFYGKNAK